MREPQYYPKWKYHATQPARIVASPEAETALGDGWVDSPADVPTADSDEQAEEQAVEVLQAVLAKKKRKKA